MRIGISGYVGDRLTGIGRVLVHVLKELSLQYPADTFVLFENRDFDEFSKMFSGEANVIIIKTNVSKHSPYHNILWHQFAFQRLLKKHNCDISLIPNFSLLLWRNKPTVVIIHDLIEFHIRRKFSRIRMLYRKMIVPWMAKNSDSVITVSESSKLDIVRFCGIPETKITVICNAVDGSRFKKSNREQVFATKEKYGLKDLDYLLFVGTIDFPGKNIKSLIEAFFNLKEKRQISEKLVVVGKQGFNAKVIFEFVNNSRYKDEVLFAGFVDDEDLPVLYAGAKVFLYLSLYEGFGLPVLEAMACGTPVICSNTSSFPELVNGLDAMVNPLSILEIESKLATYLENDNIRRQIAELGFQRSKDFSWHHSAVKYMHVFKQIRRSGS